MRRPRVTITLNPTILSQVDALIDHIKIRNRSHAIEYLVGKYFQPHLGQAVLLAGGKDTDSRSLLPIHGKPLLEYQVLQLKEHGITDIIICIKKGDTRIKEYFGNGKKFGVTFTYSEEQTPLHTGGALLKAKKHLHLKTPFLVIHGDVLTDCPYQDIFQFHQREQSIATITLASINNPDTFGQLKLHGTRLVNFYQKSSKEVKSHLVNCGIYVFEPTIFNYFPKHKSSFLLEDVIENLIMEKKVSGFVFEGQWFDAGTTEGYKNASRSFNLS